MSEIDETPGASDRADLPEPPQVVQPTPEPSPESVAPAFEESAPAAKVAPLPDGSKRAKRAAAPKPSASADKKGGRRRNYTLVTIFSSFRAVTIVFAVAVITGTIFTSFTTNDSLSPQTRSTLAVVQITEAQRGVQVTDLPTPVWLNRIGIVAGHSGIAKRGPTKGNVDPGNVCPDGFTEASVTMKVATQVVAALRGRGYTVDLLEEFDPKLSEDSPIYQAATFLSIHADSCVSFNDGYPHSGFSITNPTLRATVRDQDLRLVDCIRNNYGQSTGLKFSGWTITPNMYDYHAFREISQRTPAAIIELGLMYYDRDLLEHHPDKSADGIVQGILCFLDPKSMATATLPPTLTAPVPSATTPPRPTSGTPKR